jgi:hypothetical protein
MFSDADLEVDTAAIKRHVRFLRSHGVAQLAEVGKLGQTPPDLSRSELRSPSASECIDGDRSDPRILPLEGRGRLSWRTGLGIFLTTVRSLRTRLHNRDSAVDGCRRTDRVFVDKTGQRSIDGWAQSANPLPPLWVEAV